MHTMLTQMLIFMKGVSLRKLKYLEKTLVAYIGENDTSNKLNSHTVSAGLEPVTRTYGTTVMTDDTTHTTQDPMQTQ